MILEIQASTEQLAAIQRFQEAEGAASLEDAATMLVDLALLALKHYPELPRRIARLEREED